MVRQGNLKQGHNEAAAGCTLHKDALGCNMSVSVPRLLNAVDASVALVRGP